MRWEVEFELFCVGVGVLVRDDREKKEPHVAAPYYSFVAGSFSEHRKNSCFSSTKFAD
jgi:hypothetical protein